ncbi:hypothetical protein AMTRI_Chr02g211950 [Amborella trichopoda]
MGNGGESLASQNNGGKRKSPFQIESLENFYTEDRYPSPESMREYARALRLTYKQIRGWFSDRRRRDRQHGLCFSSRKPLSSSKRARELDHNMESTLAKKTNNRTFLDYGTENNPLSCNSKSASAKKNNSNSCKALEQRQKNRVARIKYSRSGRKLLGHQYIMSADQILQSVFRKDGPPLGSEFDPLPQGAFGMNSESIRNHSACQGTQRGSKRRKVCVDSELPMLDSQVLQRKNVPASRHGLGKGLMSLRILRKDYSNGSVSISRIRRRQTIRRQKPVERKRSSHGKFQVQGKAKSASCRRMVQTNQKKKNHIKSYFANCNLALKGQLSVEQLIDFSALPDDEELELRELRVTSNRLASSAHLTANCNHGCALCKDLLGRFPPHSVEMKQPLRAGPWDSSSETVKKLFKVFKFLYAHAEVFALGQFTLDEFAQAFHDQDSLLLGTIHMALIKYLLVEIGRELSAGSFIWSRAHMDCRFLGFLQSIKQQGFDPKLWNRFLNPLTWTEILRQIMLAAGFGRKQHSSLPRKGIMDKDNSKMLRHGISPGSLKGELYRLLSERGSNGLKISDLVKAFQVSSLNQPMTIDGLEPLVSSTLSSDITLFEKISPTAYRLRGNPGSLKGSMQFDSDSEDSGSVDNDSVDEETDDSEESDASEESDSEMYEGSKRRRVGFNKKLCKSITEGTEIDESHVGEAWVLGLMEGEYSNLSIEEKLNALVALVDLMDAGPGIQKEDPARARLEMVPETRHHGSGAKIKRSSASYNKMPVPLQSLPEHDFFANKSQASNTSRSEPSAINKSNFPGIDGPTTKPIKAKNLGSGSHPMQSIFLGSDRRYNSYWLFLGPCNADDPGHRRIYFESSEDGHWEVIDSEKALHALLTSLDGRGTREAHLLSSLEKRESFLFQTMADSAASESIRHNVLELGNFSGDGTSPVSDIDNNSQLSTECREDSFASSGAIQIELGKSDKEKKHKWGRLRALDAWIWNDFYENLNAPKYKARSAGEQLIHCRSCHDLYWRDERHCAICHSTFELDFDLEAKYTIHVAKCKKTDNDDAFSGHRVLSSRLQSLKAAIHAIEAVMTEETFVASWTESAHKLWVSRLRRASSMPELLQVLTDFVGAINEDWLCQSKPVLGANTVIDEIVVFFPNIPQTTSALALWLVKLDAFLSDYLKQILCNPIPRAHSQRKVQTASDLVFFLRSLCNT